jgi:hypothetical protein
MAATVSLAAATLLQANGTLNTESILAAAGGIVLNVRAALSAESLLLTNGALLLTSLAEIVVNAGVAYGADHHIDLGASADLSTSAGFAYFHDVDLLAYADLLCYFDYKQAPPPLPPSHYKPHLAAPEELGNYKPHYAATPAPGRYQNDNPPAEAGSNHRTKPACIKIIPGKKKSWIN